MPNLLEELRVPKIDSRGVPWYVRRYTFFRLSPKNKNNNEKHAKNPAHLFEELRRCLQLGVYIGACVQEHLRRFGVASPGGEHEGGAAGVGHGVHLVTLREQDFARLRPALRIMYRAR